MTFSYNYLLVALSVAVAIQAGFVGLNLAQRVPASFALNRRLLIVASAATLSVGIWSMHFIGMLAIITTATIDYVVLPTLLSFLVCVLVTGVSIYAASLRSSLWLFAGALFMGLGIATMHYVGMMALHASAHMEHDPRYVAASVVIAIAASGLALWLAYQQGTRFPNIVGAIVFGLAAPGMHYTAMAGTTLMFQPDLAPAEVLISSDILAMIVSVVAFSISGIFMLALIPRDQPGSPNDQKWSDGDEPNLQAVTLSAASANVSDEMPLTQTTPFNVSPVLLPIEKSGQRFHMSVADIVSVHANAHYTFLFNGSDDLFCPLPISEVDERLDEAQFFRTHRSYIVNLNNVVRLKKSGDGAIAELDSSMRRTVPVSRNRVAQLREAWAAFKADNGPAPN
ncbi:MAG: MHYT domain-containing protein [Rhizobiaceae bacterium]